MKPKKSLFSRSGHAAAFVIAVTFSVTGQSFAADYDWNAATADFNNPANWSLGGSPAPGVPGPLDTANVANGGTAQWTINEAKTVQELRAGNTAGGTISISGGNTFSTSGVYAGRQNGAAAGTLTVSGTGTILNVTAGVSHVVAISGWNIALVAGLVAGLLRRRGQQSRWRRQLHHRQQHAQWCQSGPGRHLQGHAPRRRRHAQRPQRIPPLRRPERGQQW